ncbi:hypothetical protein BDQ17DRAFT_1435970 [Cyathus striatus]|nr:hypothetical protein BDQ17DRAFT_1435970 [Cyathus striatus]
MFSLLVNSVFWNVIRHSCRFWLASAQQCAGSHTTTACAAPNRDFTAYCHANCGLKSHGAATWTCAIFARQLWVFYNHSNTAKYVGFPSGDPSTWQMADHKAQWGISGSAWAAAAHSICMNWVFSSQVTKSADIPHGSVATAQMMRLPPPSSQSKSHHGHGRQAVSKVTARWPTPTPSGSYAGQPTGPPKICYLREHESPSRAH